LEDLESDSNEKQLNSIVRKFHAELKKKNGEMYSKLSFISIRYRLQRYFMKTKDTDIINNQEFKPANDVFKACLVNVKGQGKGETKGKGIISEKCTALEFCQQTNLPVSNTKFALNFNCSFTKEARRMYEKWKKPTLKSALTPR
jgi:hypothetical protein